MLMIMLLLLVKIDYSKSTVNVDWITADLFEEYKECYNTADIFINTSCEHMLPMKWWGPEGPRAI